MSAERAEVREPRGCPTPGVCCALQALADAQRKRDEDVDQALAALHKAEQRAAALEGALREETERCIGIVQRYLGTQNRLLAQKERDIVEAMRLPDAMGERLTRPAPRAEGERRFT